MSDDLLTRWEQIFPWLEGELGGRITRRERQGRESGGRYAWFVDLDVGGREVKTYVRGTRDDSFSYVKVYSTARETKILQILHDEGIPVPEVLAFHEDPQAAVLAHVEGRDNFNLVTDPAERDSIAEHFLETLAELHSVDIHLFEQAGVLIPETPEQIALNDLDVWQSTYEAGVRDPLPILSFACRWLRRNVPRNKLDPVLCQGDTGPGNLLYHEGKVSALVDFELAHISDPMTDIACVRSRDLYTPIDRFPERLARYSELSGREIDFEALHFYSVKTQALVPMALAPVMENLHAGTEHAEWIAQHVFYLRTTAQALAEAIGVELEEVELPDARPTRFSDYFDMLIENLEEEQSPAIEDSFLRNRMWFASRLARHLRHADRSGPAFEEQELDDMGELLGKRPAEVGEGHRRVDQLVRGSGPERDADFVRYFYRHACREEALMEGALGLCEGAQLAPLR
ncbi:MAG: phosphotransferase family protein [bacterium]|nr:phosphotransferase family protein [bacterium]